MDMGNKSKLATWKYDYFQIPFWCGTGRQLMGNSKCPTKDLFFHSVFGKPHKELSACSQPSPALSQRCLRSTCSWLRVTHKPLLQQPLKLASPILKSISALLGIGRSNQPSVPAAPPGRYPNLILKCFTATIFLHKLLTFENRKIPHHRT